MTKPQSTGKAKITAQDPNQSKDETPIRVDGFEQILEMLKIADPAFRDSLLRRLAVHDAELTRNLISDLGL